MCLYIVILQWLINITADYYTYCRKFLWDGDTSLQQFYNKKDQCLQLFLALFVCAVKLKVFDACWVTFVATVTLELCDHASVSHNEWWIELMNVDASCTATKLAQA